MARHAHQWRVTLYVLLALPDREDMADRVLRWDCAACGQYVILDGQFRLGVPLQTPEYWDRVRRQEQRAGTPEAREASRQQAGRRRRLEYEKSA